MTLVYSFHLLEELTMVLRRSGRFYHSDVPLLAPKQSRYTFATPVSPSDFDWGLPVELAGGIMLGPIGDSRLMQRILLHVRFDRKCSTCRLAQRFAGLLRGRLNWC